MPAKSMRSSVLPGDSFFKKRRTSAADNPAINKFTKKKSRQSPIQVTTPAISGPATLPPVTPARIKPIARPRLSASTLVVPSANMHGQRSAAPIPCTARDPMSQPILGAAKQLMEATKKIVMPTRIWRRCPNISPNRPPVTTATPNVRA